MVYILIFQIGNMLPICLASYRSDGGLRPACNSSQ